MNAGLSIMRVRKFRVGQLINAPSSTKIKPGCDNQYSKEKKMLKRRLTILIVVVFSLVFTLPAFADAPGDGTVFEGVSVPGIALGDTREQVEASVGPHRNCVSNNDPPTMESCSYDVEGGGWVSVRFRGPTGSEATGSQNDVVSNIRWSEDVDGWVTSAGISISLIKFDKQLAIDTYPNATLYYNEFGSLVRLTDYDLGISISWDAVYIFFSASMSIFEPYTPAPPPDPDLIRVADIEFSYDRRSVTAKVLVVDEQDQPIEGAVVGGYWVHPVNKNNNTTLFIDGTTAEDGFATFRIDKARPGDYRLTISYVNKEGFEFDVDGSILVGVFTKPK
jgi:hypothetical protein